ncbi:MAG: Asp-tRNA(Asn)/Glu-tRNA(Gln) amidotransferase GatCAB subunit A, partial [Dehalococcoidia bacterium]|nr:Asp-tRNA(Asn)/Glu-tRNA(Gln) amidotransferase GatCAB subunit A [Dehalococcoidia bacterium]
MTIAGAGRMLRGGETTSVALTEAAIARMEATEARLNAFITPTPDDALASARQADADLAAGNDHGPLHGIPIAIKDLCATRGIRTTAGSAVLGDWVPDFDATVVRKLHEGGAVSLGKLNLHEFAFGTTSMNEHYGAVHNPWDLSRHPGGSSGGSGAAVAAGVVFGAIGTDTGGSIRMPAALCGTAGLMPTYGVVSRKGVTALSWSLDHI